MTVTDLHLAHHTLPKEEIEEIILSALRNRSGALTIHDLVLATGLPGTVLEPVFRSMVLRYESTVSVDASGELFYRFDPSLKPLDDGEALKQYRFRKKLWAAFKVFYKVLIVVILIGYVIAFLALFIAAFVFASQGRKDSNSQRGRSSGRGSTLSPFGNYWLMRSLIGTGRRGRRGPTFAPSRYSTLPKKDERPIWEKTFSFVFGLDAEGDDPLVDQKQLLAYIVEQRGIIAPMELSGRTGWSPEASERESSKLIAEYDGGVDILPDGHTVFAFDQLRDAVPAGTRPTPAYWERFETKATNSGNQRPVDLGIGALNVFVLISSVYLAPAFIIPTLFEPHDYGVAALLLVVIPGLFSLSFFGIPLGRYLRTTRPENAARERRNARRVMLREVYRRALRGEAQATEFEILDAAMREHRPNNAVFASGLQQSLLEALRQIADDWSLPVDLNEQTERVYTLTPILIQHQEAAAVRARPGSIATNRMHDAFAAFDEELLETPAMSQNFTPASAPPSTVDTMSSASPASASPTADLSDADLSDSESSASEPATSRGRNDFF